LKGFAAETEFHINQASRRVVSEVWFCLSLQNLLCKALNQKKKGICCYLFFDPHIKQNTKKIKKIYSKENQKK
jgi:hypothetical protein